MAKKSKFFSGHFNEKQMRQAGFFIYIVPPKNRRGHFFLLLFDQNIRGSFFMFVESGCISTNIEFKVP